jgi:hypothetical protein
MPFPWREGIKARGKSNDGIPFYSPSPHPAPVKGEGVTWLYERPSNLFYIKRGPMTFKAIDGFDAAQIPLMIDMIPVAITVIDLEGHILFYNDYSSQVLDRKPEYLGTDIRDCHQKPDTNVKIDRMLNEFKTGRREDFYYEAFRYEKNICVTLSPFEVDGQLIGCIQSVVIKRS